MQIPRGMHANRRETVLSRLFRRMNPVGLARRACRPEFDAQDGRWLGVQANGASAPSRNGNAMKTSHRTTPVGGMRRLGTAFIRMAVGLLLASAITVAVVASGLDLLPLRP